MSTLHVSVFLTPSPGRTYVPFAKKKNGLLLSMVNEVVAS